MAEGDLEWMLQKEGLNKYQRDAYAAMLAQKNASASEIASRSGVPESKLYEVLRELERRGLVHGSLGRPKKFSVVEPRKAFAPLLARHAGELEREKRVLEQVNSQAAESGQKEEVLRLLRGRDVVLSQIASQLKDKTFSSVDGCFPFNNPYAPITNALHRKSGEGVKIRLIGEVTSENYPLVKKYIKWGVQVRNSRRIAPPNPLRFTVFDNKFAAFTLTDVNHEYITIWTDSPAVVKSIADLFTYYWNNGLRVG